MTPAQLFHACDHIVGPDSDYPPGTQRLAAAYPVAGQGFFPVVSGSFHCANLHAPIAPRRLMFVGQDWGCSSNLAALALDPAADIKSGTGRNLDDLLARASISKQDCFFTNALFGVRTSATNTGRSPAWGDTAFVDRCTEALLQQIRVVQPRTIVCLGRHAPRLLEKIIPACGDWRRAPSFAAIDQAGKGLIPLPVPILGVGTVALLVHPSFRHANVRHRRFETEQGEDAEILILQNC